MLKNRVFLRVPMLIDINVTDEVENDKEELQWQRRCIIS